MKRILGFIILVSVLCGCRNTEDELFFADNPPLNQSDSLVMMELYESLNLKNALREPWVVRHPDSWKGVTFEYDEVSGERYVSRIDLGLGKAGIFSDSIPSSLGRLSHLRYLRIVEFIYYENFPIPKEIFNCPLESLILTNGGHWDFGDNAKGFSGRLPAEIYNVRNTLRDLRITDTNLTDISRNIQFLENLAVCDLHGNKLKDSVLPEFRLLNCQANLSDNYFDFFPWYILDLGGNIPNVRWNYISNFVPDEILEGHYDYIRNEICPQNNSHLWSYINYWKSKRE